MLHLRGGSRLSTYWGTSTDMSTQYCERWFYRGKRPIRPTDPSLARRCHENGEPYVAVVPSFEQPAYVISVARPWVTVGFLDAHLREYMTFSFHERKPRRLFMTMALHREFAGASDEVVRATTMAFEEDGTMLAEERDLASGDVSERRGRVDVSANWGEYPSFGDYGALCREERGEQPG